MQNVDRPTGSSLAGAAILLEIGAAYGIVDFIRHSNGFDVAALAERSGIGEPVIADYVDAMREAGLVTLAKAGERDIYRPADDFPDVVNDVGYLSWALLACAPLIVNAREFAADNALAQARHPRDGGLVARTSKWMGELSFYPQPERAILKLRPKKIVDLGSGSGGFLIRMLHQLDGARGVGVDLSATATEQAKQAAEANGFAGRLEFLHRPIQSLVDDPAPLKGADVVHAGFVMHDLLPAEERTLDALLETCREHASSGTVVIVDAVPLAPDRWERSFAAAFNHLHRNFMSRRLLSEDAWREKFEQAGFGNVVVETLGHPGGRMILGSA